MKDGADSSREAMGLGDGWVKEWNRTGISIIRIISTSWQRPHSFSCDAILPLLYFPLFSAFRWLLYAISLSLSLISVFSSFSLWVACSSYFSFFPNSRTVATLRCIPLRPEQLTATFPSVSLRRWKLPPVDSSASAILLWTVFKDLQKTILAIFQLSFNIHWDF